MFCNSLRIKGPRICPETQNSTPQQQLQCSRSLRLVCFRRARGWCDAAAMLCDALAALSGGTMGHENRRTIKRKRKTSQNMYTRRTVPWSALVLVQLFKGSRDKNNNTTTSPPMYKVFAAFMQVLPLLHTSISGRVHSKYMPNTPCKHVPVSSTMVRLSVPLR